MLAAEVEEGRLRTIAPARNMSVAGGLAEAGIFAMLSASGSWLRAQMISASANLKNPEAGD
jgi:hypothetical protein